MAQLYPTYSDSELMRLMAQGEEAALTELYNRYWESLYNAACKRTRSDQQSQDIVQEVFIDLWQRSGQVTIADVPAYLHTAVQYQIYKLIRRQKAGPAFFELFEMMGSSDDTAERLIREKELLSLVVKWIATLPEKRRAIFRMHYVDGLSREQIAAALHISEKTVRNQLGRSLESFRLELAHFLSLFFL